MVPKNVDQTRVIKNPLPLVEVISSMMLDLKVVLSGELTTLPGASI
jgi:hypothetical protein